MGDGRDDHRGGFYGSNGPFRAIPGMFLTGPAAISSIGNPGGFFGPSYVGFMEDLTGGHAGGLYALALFGLLAAAITAFFPDIPKPGRTLAQPANAQTNRYEACLVHQRKYPHIKAKAAATTETRRATARLPDRPPSHPRTRDDREA